MSLLPTNPDEFASPSGNWFDVDSCSRRGVPMPLPQTMTDEARVWCSSPSTSYQVAPLASPVWSTVISLTLASVISFAPAAKAAGHIATSNEDLAPSGHPDMQVAHLAHAPRSPWLLVLMARELGHQCQPSLFMPAAALRPIRPMGTGGMVCSRPAGSAGSPARPDVPTNSLRM